MARGVSATWESEIAYNHGVADERERIISLLVKESCTCLSTTSEEEFYQLYGNVQELHTNCDQEISISEVIELIKGETK